MFLAYGDQTADIVARVQQWPRWPTSEQAQLIAKFPAFDNHWADEVKLAWFRDFERLMDMVERDYPSATIG